MLDDRERIFEFFLNHLRLREGLEPARFERRTGIPWGEVSGQVAAALEIGLLIEENGNLRPSELGWRFSNETQAIFLP